MWEGFPMIRAIISTVAVLAGFAVVERSSDASTGLAGSCKITQASMRLHPGEQVPVRSQPTPEGAVVGALATQDMSGDLVTATVTLTGSQNGWARIALTSKEYTSIDGTPQLYGWIPADMLAVDSRLDGAVTIYDRPGMLGSATGSIK